LTTIKNLPCWIVISGGVLLGLLLEIISVYLIFAHYTWHTAVIFQNADEVRATGGFFGSLLWVEGQGAQINHYHFYDVYDLQAQIGHFPPAPAAVRRYLSGGRSRLQLQDANWERDFALSASTISSLLQQARLPAPDIVIAVNSTLVERILAYLQSHLPDYNLRDEHGTLITADNFTTIARRDHQLTAFPRLPKTRFLRHFAGLVSDTWASLSFAQRFEVLQVLYAAKSDRLYQAYSPHAFIETFFVQIGIDGRMYQEKNCNNFYAVPSNVGINKADHYTRLEWHQPQITTHSDGTSTATYSVQVVNDNPFVNGALVTERQIWANYFRLLLPPDVFIKELTWDAVPATHPDYRTISDSRAEIWNEWGVFLVAGEQTSHTLSFTLSGPGTCWQRER